MNEAYQKTVQAYQQIIAEGKPGPTHVRLQHALDAWAVNKGFSIHHNEFRSGDKPDVLRSNPDKKLIFVGDAKDSANEDAANRQTLERIESYIIQFSLCLNILDGGKKKYNGGVIAIATDSKDAADEWVDALNFMCKFHGIYGLNPKDQPNFKCEKIDNDTWIIHW